MLVGDRVALTLSLMMVVGLAVAYFVSLACDRDSPVAICQRSDIAYWLLGVICFVGIVLRFTSTGPDWLYRGLTAVGAPVLMSLLAFSLFAGRRAGDTTLQLMLLASFLVHIGVLVILVPPSGQLDRLLVICYATGTTLGWLILERKKSFLPRKDGMVWVQMIYEDETR